MSFGMSFMYCMNCSTSTVRSTPAISHILCFGKYISGLVKMFCIHKENYKDASPEINLMFLNLKQDTLQCLSLSRF